LISFFYFILVLDMVIIYLTDKIKIILIYYKINIL